MSNSIKAAIVCLLITGVLASGLTGCESVEEAADIAKQAAEDIGREIEDTAANLPQESGGQHPVMAPEDEEGPPITDYFGGVKPNVYRKIDDFRIFCEEGNCPEANPGKYLTNEDWLSVEESTELLTDRVRLHITPLTSVDTLANCTEKDTFSYPYELTITEKTDSTIAAKGTGGGQHERVGSGCADGTYKYRYETDETWIFTTEKPEDRVVVDAETNAPGNTINAPGWNNPQKSPAYSEYSLAVKCLNTQGFHVKSSFKVIKVNGHEAEASLQSHHEKISETESRFTFASFYNAEYTIIGFCYVYGKNGGVIGESYGEEEFVVKVTDSPQGDLPENMYMNQ